MSTTYFVRKGSIVRAIWGRRDTILFIFAGAAAEFALNKAVDWLYFTGRLPADPLKRLFSTVTYSKRIVFSEDSKALETIDQIYTIHKGVEEARKESIPSWAYLDVLYMLIYYSIVSFELLERKLTNDEKDEIYDVFLRLGRRMKLEGLPTTYTEWLASRQEHLNQNLTCSEFTIDLFKQYRKHLGALRYWLLVESQKLILPRRALSLLKFSTVSFFVPFVPLYKFSRKMKLDWFIMSLILPTEYRQQVRELSGH
jgi:uncharacterized protein (DUF2236 family)